MRDSAYDPPGLEPQFWARPEVRHALERQDIGAIFRLLSKHGISQMRIATAAGLGQNRVSLISRDKQVVTTLTLLVRIADGLGMPDHARISLGIAPRQPARRSAVPAETSGGDAAELLRQISSARYVDTSVIQVLQGETDAIRLLDRRLGAPLSRRSWKPTSPRSRPACLTPSARSAASISPRSWPTLPRSPDGKQLTWAACPPRGPISS